jgi:hypothetical protein
VHDPGKVLSESTWTITSPSMTGKSETGLKVRVAIRALKRRHRDWPALAKAYRICEIDPA